jgi:hypothetical protein
MTLDLSWRLDIASGHPIKEETMEPNTEAVTFAVAERMERLARALLTDVEEYLETERPVHLEDAAAKVREMGAIAEERRSVV